MTKFATDKPIRHLLHFSAQRFLTIQPIHFCKRVNINIIYTRTFYKNIYMTRAERPQIRFLSINI